MASFRIHEDQENATMVRRKENADVFSAAAQRRALGDLSHFGCNQNRNSKLAEPANVTCKVQEENRTLRLIKNEKNIVPPVAQFRAFSVYEDKPTEVEVKKREPTFKPFIAKESSKENSNLFSNVAENAFVSCPPIEKLPPSKPDLPREGLSIRNPLQEKKDVESPMSMVDSSMLSLSVSKNESQILDDTLEEDTTIAETDRDMFFHVVEYRQDIYEYMKEIEVKHKASPRYMRKQPDITHVMRSVLVDWLVEVCDEYGQHNETLHLGVSYVDRFLSYMSVVRTKLQLVGTAAMYIAAKYEEVYPPEVTEFVYITDDTYTKREVLRMEHLILKVLSFDLSTPTSLAFLSHYCISNGLPKKIFHLASYIAELSLLEADPYLQFKNSIIAASALATARHCLLCMKREFSLREDLLNENMISCDGSLACEATAWPSALVSCSGYKFDDLRTCMKELARTHAHAHRQPYKVIPDKYKTNKFEAVSTIQARPLFHVPPYVAPAPVSGARTDPRAAS